MKNAPVHRLPAPLESAVQSLKLAARDAVERTIESLGLASLAAGNAFQRDGLLGAQFELNRKSAVFILTFNDAFDERVKREAGAAGGPHEPPAPTAWGDMSLVEDHEVEAQITAERFGMEVAHACEWELRELSAFVASLLCYCGSEKERNPLRPEVVGHAMVRGIEAVSDRAEIRKVLAGEISRSLRGILGVTYTDIVTDLRNAGVQPMGLSMRMSTARGRDAGTASTGFGASSRAARLQDLRSSESQGATSVAADRFDPSTRSSQGSQRPSRSFGQVDPLLMSLMRRLAFTGGGEAGNGGVSERSPAIDGASMGGQAGFASPSDFATGGRGPMPPNLINAHRDELRQASRGSLDHMVIDVIAGLFDQILSDPKVPPQMARQIARLQLPVLRAALGDSSFFSSRRHPVRRFINRIASLGAGFEDFNDDSAQRFLAKVRALVQEVVEGDFDQIETYENKLQALEAFMAEQARSQTEEAGQTADLLSQKEDELRLRQLYALRLEDELKGLAAPDFVREFISQVWSEVLICAAEKDGADAPRTQRLHHAGRELFMSVQPKPTPAARKQFLSELPKLMQVLTEGMNLIQWPEAQRRGFFGQLMPAHADALKNTSARQLDINLLARQVDGALLRPLPSRDDLKAAHRGPPTLTEEVVPPRFSAEEAQRVGLVQESAVDWSVQAAPPADEEPPPGAAPAGLTALDLDLSDEAAAATEAAEPTKGRALADHVQIGFAYQMQLDGQWQKVRLSHVSAARSFFVFTHGTRHKQTVSLTQRMLVRLCETGRLRAFENAYLIERATARARRQLSSLSGHATHAADSTAAGLPPPRAEHALSGLAGRSGRPAAP